MMMMMMISQSFFYISMISCEVYQNNKR